MPVRVCARVRQNECVREATHLLVVMCVCISVCVLCVCIYIYIIYMCVCFCEWVYLCVSACHKYMHVCTHIRNAGHHVGYQGH